MHPIKGYEELKALFAAEGMDYDRLIYLASWGGDTVLWPLYHLTDKEREIFHRIMGEWMRKEMDTAAQSIIPFDFPIPLRTEATMGQTLTDYLKHKEDESVGYL